MAKIEYRLNPETLEYEPVRIGLRKQIKQVLPQFLISLPIAILVFAIANKFIDSPVERELAQEKKDYYLKYQLLEKELNNAFAELQQIQVKDNNVYRSIFDAKKLSSDIRQAGFGGSDRYTDLKNLPGSEMLISANRKLDILTQQLVVQSKSFDEIVELVKNKEKMLASVPAIRPISNKDLTRFGSPFGMRRHPILGISRMHKGIDLTAPRGTKVYASGDGVVTRADAKSKGYGYHIRINHGFGYLTLYAHLSKILVQPGQKVKRGDVIGLVGNTGLSKGPHLHYEVHINGKPVNPINFYFNDLSDEDYEKLTNASTSSDDTHVFEIEE